MPSELRGLLVVELSAYVGSPGLAAQKSGSPLSADPKTATEIDSLIGFTAIDASGSRISGRPRGRRPAAVGEQDGPHRLAAVGLVFPTTGQCPQRRFYPNASSKEQAELSKKITHLNDGFATEKAAASIEVMTVLSDWLKRQMLGHDKNQFPIAASRYARYGSWLRSKRPEQTLRFVVGACCKIECIAVA
jgi:hypothetical protein